MWGTQCLEFAMSQAHADRNLLFGILALQMDFITRDQLIAAMQAWVFDKTQPLGKLFIKQAALDPDTHDLIEALVKKHLAQHGNDIAKSLAAVSSAAQVVEAREQLEKVTDPDVQGSLMHVSPTKPAGHDPYATRPASVDMPSGSSERFETRASVGEASSSGLRFRILRPHARGGLGEV